MTDAERIRRAVELLQPVKIKTGMDTNTVIGIVKLVGAYRARQKGEAATSAAAPAATAAPPTALLP